jgi:hypothetical protein
MTLYVLGAGATRGASFVSPSKKICLPPLNGDFFTQLQRIASDKHEGLVTAVIADVVELFGANFKGDMELVFTTLEHTLRMVGATKGNKRFDPKALKEKRDRLLQAIAAVLEESLCEGNRAVPCEHHHKLVEGMVASDAIISFNYDCTIDYALRDKGTGRWEPHYGYFLPIGKGMKKIAGEDAWRPKGQAHLKLRDSIRLLKLHGSLNFNVSEKYSLAGKLERRSVTLKARPYTKQNGPLRFSIIPPESAKAYDRGIFQGLWRRASHEIHQASTIVVIGYSFPLTDLHSSALFRVNNPKAIRNLVIVNRDPEARRRTREILRAGINPQTRVHSFDTLQEFIQCPRGVWDRQLPAVPQL